MTRFRMEHLRRTVTHRCDLLRELVIRDIKLRYKRSLLGVAWSLVTPLAQLVVFSFLFRRVVPLDIPNYSLFVFTGLLAWNWFTTSISQATVAVTENRELVKLPGFPLSILPAATVTTQLIHFLLALPILFAAMLVWGGQWTTAILVLPVIVILQYGFTLSLAYLAASLQVRYRDTQHALNILLLLGFYLTPVFYDPALIPESYQPLYALNPMTHVISGYRNILMRGEPPSSVSLALFGAVIGSLLVLGYIHFKRASHEFDEDL